MPHLCGGSSTHGRERPLPREGQFFAAHRPRGLAAADNGR